MEPVDRTPFRGGASNALFRGALLGVAVAFVSLIVVTLIEPFETGLSEGLLLFLVLPGLGAATSYGVWRRRGRLDERSARAGQRAGGRRLAGWHRGPDRAEQGRRRNIGPLSLVAIAAVLAVAGTLLSQLVGEAAQRIDRTPGTETTIVEEVAGRPEVRIAVAGDTGTGTALQWRTARTMFLQGQSRPYDALVLLGDLIYPSGEAALVQDVVTGPFSPVLSQGTELVPVLGNHDYQSGEQQQILAALDRRSSWYVERVGTVRVIALDSNRVGDPAQTEWLQAVLAEPQPPGTWTIAAMHHPPYSAGAHGSDLDVRRAWGDLFAQHDVPLVLAGHDHDYQRSTPQDGVTYVVSGAGAKLRPTGEADFTAVSSSTLHYLDLLVYDDKLVGRAIDHNGKTFDEFIIEDRRGR